MSGTGLRRFSIGLVGLILLACGNLAVGEEVKFGPCYARWSATELVVGNEHVERKWSIEGGLLRATSFYDRDSNREWLSRSAKAGGAAGALTVEARGGVFSPVEAPSLLVEVRKGKDLQYRMQVFPKARGVEISLQPGEPVPAVVKAESDAGGASILERESNGGAKGKEIDTPDELSLVPLHLRVTQVTLNTDTDHHNQLVFLREWMPMNNESDLMLHGDLFFAEDVVTGSGLIFLKQAALPEARAVQTDADLRVIANSRTFRFLSQGFASTVLAYSGGRVGRIEALQTYQRQLRKYVSGRDGLLMTNTWGDRKRDSAIDAGFVAKEIAADGKLGVDVAEIDDGWQSGRSVNSARGPGVGNGFWSTPTPFWDVDATRFPKGLEPLVAQAKEDHMTMGLWYAPDSSHEFANWQKDADEILGFYRKDGIANFKFDSINMSSQKAEDNLHKMFDRILVESKGQVVIDLDVTGTGKRPGYFGLMESGPIFVENRYTDFHRYWPHLTLRNLWELSEYVDPLRLRMEFLNNTRNLQRYPNDPLAPAKYSADALFATVMVANPLGWFDASDLPDEYVAAAAPLVKTWKQERDAMYRGTLIPIGDAPDGVSWTGFATVGTKPDASYVLVFRELNAKADWTVELPMDAGATARVTMLAGHGTAKVEDGKLVVHVPEMLQYLWVRLD